MLRIFIFKSDLNLKHHPSFQNFRKEGGLRFSHKKGGVGKIGGLF